MGLIDKLSDDCGFSFRHLARNPFICDCNLHWLSEYLHDHPIETSGARCETPRRMRRKKIGHVRATKFKCKGVLRFECFLFGS